VSSAYSLTRNLSKLDYSRLHNSPLNESFCDKVKSTLPHDAPSIPYSSLQNAVTTAALAILPNKASSKNDWYNDSKAVLSTAITRRNLLLRDHTKNLSHHSKKILKDAQHKVKSMVKKAKSDWLLKIANQLNLSTSSCGIKASGWRAIKKIKAGICNISSAKQTPLRKPNNTLCSSTDENADVFLNHFKLLYQRIPSYDPSVIALVQQMPIMHHLAERPNSDEIHKAISKLNDTAPGISGIRSTIWKLLAKDPIMLSHMTKIIHQFWRDESAPEEWLAGELAILEKKGDLSDPNNYRGIMLLETFYKIIANVLHAKLLPIVESLDNESQCGFRPGRSCIDAIFTVKMALKKRAEHNQETYVLFLDLVKAFDRVPRVLLWQILDKSGVPRKIINLIRTLHTDVNVSFKIGNSSRSFSNSIGVKQGDTLGPLLFLFFITAILKTWQDTSLVNACHFRSMFSLEKLHGRRPSTIGDPFSLLTSAYADDTAAFFTNREEATAGVQEIYAHFARFGMEIHTA